MKKGQVICLNISHKDGTQILNHKDLLTENDVHDFDSLVKSGHIKELSDNDYKKLKNPDTKDEKKPEPESKPEPKSAKKVTK